MVIIPAVKSLIEQIEEFGKDYKNTRELVGFTLDLDFSSTNFGDEYRSVLEYYGADKFNRKYREEQFHYGMIENGLIHKAKETNYFFKEYLESRKIVIFSTDCISLVQMIKRGPDLHLLVFMRSSDVVGLLPMDLLYLYYAILAFAATFSLDPRKVLMTVTIGSAHYYINGERNQ